MKTTLKALQLNSSRTRCFPCVLYVRLYNCTNYMVPHYVTFYTPFLRFNYFHAKKKTKMNRHKSTVVCVYTNVSLCHCAIVSQSTHRLGHFQTLFFHQNQKLLYTSIHTTHKTRALLSDNPTAVRKNSVIFWHVTPCTKGTAGSEKSVGSFQIS